MSTLSIVIISKNEEKHIKATIESVLAATQKENLREIVVVDSASTDQTVRIAQQFPVTIVQIQAGYYLSPAAGRYIGFRYCSGDYIFFLDGDMLLDQNWFRVAIPILEKDPKLAGIAGRCEGMVYRHFGNTTHLGGAALYRYHVLADPNIGNFNPWLCNEEEIELGLRISAAGYYLQRIDQKMTIHCSEGYYSSENASGLTLKQIKRDWRTGRYKALGQVLRLLWRNPLRHHFVKVYQRALALIPLYLLGLISLISAIFDHSLLYPLLWLCLFIGLFVTRAVYKKDFYDTLLFFIANSLAAIGFVSGWFQPVPRQEQYQPKLVEIQ